MDNVRFSSGWVIGPSEEKLAEHADEISANMEKKLIIRYFIDTFNKLRFLF